MNNLFVPIMIVVETSVDKWLLPVDKWLLPTLVKSATTLPVVTNVGHRFYMIYIAHMVKFIC